MDLGNIRGRFNKPRISACVERLESFMDERSKNKGAVIKLYLNSFKSYNDAFGYTFGGKLINEITAFLESFEELETYHIRGVEYIIIAKGSSRQVINDVVDVILQRFEETWTIDDIVCLCSVNAGIVYFPGFANTPDEILEQLGHTISESAGEGQNCLVEYDDELIEKFRRRNIIAQQIPQAVKSGAMEMRLWPVYQASTKSYKRIDCRFRMFCDPLGFIQEEEFIPVAEQSGQIYTISQFAVTSACQLIAELIAQGKDFETVAVRISPIQLLQERFVSDVAEIIEKAGIPAKHLAFEVDESAAYSAFFRAHMCMNELTDLGIEMVLTDFGTGSLGVFNILSMSIDAVKISRALVWQLDNSTNGASLIDGLINLSRSFGLKFVAEGVETEQQVKLLDELGCEYRQGFYYSQALSAEELFPLLAEPQPVDAIPISH